MSAGFRSRYADSSPFGAFASFAPMWALAVEDHGACDSEMGEHHLSEILIEYFLSILYGESCVLKGKSLKLRDIVFFCL